MKSIYQFWRVLTGENSVAHFAQQKKRYTKKVYSVEVNLGNGY